MRKMLALTPGLVAWVGLIVVSIPVFAQNPGRSTQVDQTRIEQRQQSRQTVLDELRAQRISERCEAAQTKLETHLQNAQSVLDRRKQTYSTTQAKLNAIITRLDASGLVDTSNLSTQASQLDALVVEFMLHYETYLAALTDASGSDCAEIPAGFIAAVEEAREQAAQLKLKAVEIRSYAVDTIGATIANLKIQLDAGQGV